MKIFIVIIAFILVIIGGGYWWQKNKNQKTVIPTSSPEISPTPQYPKIESYQVPILMYHYIRNAENESQLGKNLSVSPANFESQVKWLKDDNYVAINMSDLIDPGRKVLSKITFEKKKPIVLTFDDGYVDAFTQALPVLQKYQMTATFYIISNYIGRPEYMDQSQINELEKNGFELGSHTLSHPDLTKISSEEAQSQIVDSKGKTSTFCYPAGKYNMTTVKQVQEAGYTTAVTTHFGIADQKSNILELPRVRVEEGSGEILGQKIEAAYE